MRSKCGRMVSDRQFQRLWQAGVEMGVMIVKCELTVTTENPGGQLPGLSRVLPG